MSHLQEQRYAEYSAALGAAQREELEAQGGAKRQELFQQGAFASTLSFGTGGVRAKVGHGTATLNAANIARLTLALAKTLNAESAKPESGAPLVVIAYDSRNTSLEFARTSYHTLLAQNIQVKLFARPAPTPLLSFAVRQLGAQAGIVITASHNPPAYNGFKVYAADGGQITSPNDQAVVEHYQQIKYSELDPAILAKAGTPPAEEDLIGDEMTAIYGEYLQTQNLCDDNPKQISILYSPLHGTGARYFQEIFTLFGFQNFGLLAEQSEPDGDFPTLEFPNPEEPSAFELLVKAGRPKKSALLLASDPDADRIGAAIYDGAAGDYRFLNGNQIGSLMLDHMIRQKGASLKEPFICKTIVTTLMQNKIASDRGVKLVETLTGFKYIAAEIARDPENYLFGGEESYGYLPVSGVRDKDSISSGLVLAQMAEHTDLLAKLDSLYLEHGLFYDKLISISLENSADPSIDLVSQLIEKIAGPAAPLDTIVGKKLGSRKIVDLIDFREGGTQPLLPEAAELKKSLDPSRVIQLWLAPQARLTLRPSGTEPKIKIYLSMFYPKQLTAEGLPKAKEEIAEEALIILDEFGKLLDIDITH